MAPLRALRAVPAPASSAEGGLDAQRIRQAEGVRGEAANLLLLRKEALAWLDRSHVPDEREKKFEARFFLPEQPEGEPPAQEVAPR